MTVYGWPKSISWGDFGTPVKKVPTTYKGTHTNCHIEVNVDLSFSTIAWAGGGFQLSNIKVTVSMDAHKSWILDGVQTGSDAAAVLAHEQGHYDIAGITARDIDNAIAGYTDTTSAALSKRTKATGDQTNLDGQKAENTYDGDVTTNGTDNGNDAAQQAKWLVQIGSATSLSDLPQGP